MKKISWSWGQLGDGITSDSTTPVAVTGITNAKAIAAGVEHTCALLQGGTVQCWGNPLAVGGGPRVAGWIPTPVRAP